MNAFHPLLTERRARAARLVVLGVAAVMLVAFFRTQILEFDTYATQSQSNRRRPIPLPAARGTIYDRNGLVLAESVPGFTVALLPGPEDSLRATLRRIARLADLDSAAIEQVIRRYRRAPYQPALVRADAPLAMVAALEERRLDIPGLLIQTEPKRYYPDSSAAAHILGYVGEVAESERRRGRDAPLTIGSLVGKDGLEREYDDSLRGEDGMRFVEVSALGRMVRDVDVQGFLEPVAGASLRTTIDLDLQRFVASVFPRGRRGAVVALDPTDGAVLALYSAPGFDPNAFVGGVAPEYWRTLTEDPARPLLNRAVQARYPPGSTWKLAVAAMALKRGLVGFRSRMPIPCRGGLQYGNRFFRCWQLEGHGDLNLEQAIAHSCDVYFYQLGLKLGVTSLLEDAVAWGGRARTGIDLPGELQSEFPSGREYYDRLYGPRRWTSAVALNLAIGQGENAQTPVNMARMYQMLASDGVPRTPHVVRAQAGDQVDPFALTPEQLDGLRRAMINVVEAGTARASRVAALTIAGKTATSQNPHGADHGWFIGFAPAEAPRIVVAAVVEFAEHGSLVAPMVTRIIARYLDADSVDIGALRLPRDSAPAAMPLPGFPASIDPRDTTAPRPR
ncbi:MAG TPA: penicillin-binding protein 2 [Gemmatimonadales bacterium]|nr:penicillin-binding protein 2 [Gemmatimonadales bacterium]